MNHKTQKYTAVFLVAVGAAMLVGGFYAPPLGRIDSSVLVAFGEILTWAGTIFGIDYHYKYKDKL